MQLSKLGASCLLAASLAACGLGTSAVNAASNQQPQIKVFYYSLNDLFINQLSVALQDSAIANQVKLAQYDANDDLLRQVSQIQTALSIGDSKAPILVNPVDTQNGTAALRAAKQSKVPIIFFNRKPDDKALASYEDAWYIGAIPASSGYYQAEIVMDYYKAHPEMDKNKDGKISYVMIKGEAGHQDTNARSNTFVRTLLDAKYNLQPIDSVYANWSQATAQNQMSNILDRHPIENIELIVCNNDAMALGALLALQAEGYNTVGASADKSKFIPIVGIDALPAAMDAVESGTLIGTVLNDYNSMADVMIRISQAYLNGEVVTEELIGQDIQDHSVYIPYIKVTNQNVADLRD